MDTKLTSIRMLITDQQIFTLQDIKELKRSIYILFKNYIFDNILEFSSPLFDNNLTKYINGIQIGYLIPVYSNSQKYRLKYKLARLINTVKKELFKTIIPPRSYKTSFLRKIVFNTEELSKKVKKLQDIPQPTQRTSEWYQFRHNLLTASSIWKVFGTQASQNQIIYEKCAPFAIHKNAPITSPLHWGQNMNQSL